jgi:hypothetical protein
MVRNTVYKVSAVIDRINQLLQLKKSVLQSRSRWGGNFLLEPEPKFFGLFPAPVMDIHKKCYKKS